MLCLAARSRCRAAAVVTPAGSILGSSPCARRMSIMSALNAAEQKKKAALIHKLKAAAKDVAGGSAMAGSPAALAASASDESTLQIPDGAAAADGALVPAPAQSVTPEAPGRPVFTGKEAVTEYNTEMVAKVLTDLETKSAVHKETMKIIESSREWQDYDSHVGFELLMLKHRYQMSPDLTMTSERRAQMQAHLRAKQKQIMEMHADKAAEAYLSSLTSDERKKLAQRLLRIDAPALASRAKDGAESFSWSTDTPSVSDVELQAALADLAREVTAASEKRKKKPAGTGAGDGTWGTVGEAAGIGSSGIGGGGAGPSRTGPTTFGQAFGSPGASVRMDPEAGAGGAGAATGAGAGSGAGAGAYYPSGDVSKPGRTYNEMRAEVASRPSRHGSGSGSGKGRDRAAGKAKSRSGRGSDSASSDSSDWDSSDGGSDSSASDGGGSFRRR